MERKVKRHTTVNVVISGEEAKDDNDSVCHRTR